MKKINPSKSFIILSAGTDGRDGPTNAAGGILNQGSLEKIKNKKVNLEKELLNNNSLPSIEKNKFTCNNRRNKH